MPQTETISLVEQALPAAAEQLLPVVYDELRKLATTRLKQERPGHTLIATDLVHEAYLRLVDSDPTRLWNGQGHFFAAAAEAMRRILLERARRKKSLKRGGNRNRVDLLDRDLGICEPTLDLLALDDALDLLEDSDPRAAQVIKLRFFRGLTISETAATLGISVATADNDWAFARSWLRVRMTADN